MRDRSEWIRGETGPQKIGTRSYKRLTEFSRPCATCKQPFSIFVTEKIAEGLADSNNFGLRNCEVHRRGAAPIDSEELESLRTKDRVMADELSGLSATIRDLKERLAKAEARPAPKAPTRDLTFPWGQR